MTTAEIASLLRESAEKHDKANVRYGRNHDGTYFSLCKDCSAGVESVGHGLAHRPHCIVTRLRNAAEDVEKMTTALADAIRRPMGVIPDSAKGLVTDADLAAAEHRRGNKS